VHVSVQPSTLCCHLSATASHSSAAFVSPLRFAMSAAQTRPAIAAAIVAGE
jgi:hypothetical protein